MEKCSDPEIGILISNYQLGSLTKKEQTRFEEHLFECSYCVEELNEMSDINSVLRENKNEIVSALNADGLNLNSLKKEILKEKKSLIKSKFPDIIFEWLGCVFSIPKVFVPVSIAVSVVLFAIVFQLNLSENPYVDILQFDNNQENILVLRDVPTSDGEKLFRMGISEYLNGNLESAIPFFEKTVQILPKEFDAWFYLGVTHYLNRDGKSAIKSLIQARKLNPASELTKLYLAEAYLLRNLPELAIPILKSIQIKNNDYSQRATSYLASIEKIQTEKD